jgi:non-haem Fe2+, alpha-ketoglutarate-dependent halogenase
MSGLLSNEQVERYRQDGVVFPARVLSDDEIEKFRTAFLTLESRLGGRPAHRQLIQPHLCYRWAFDLATHPRVLDVVEQIIGPNILVHSTSLFPKYPSETDGISWHQDAYYWGLSSPQLVSAWVALTDSTITNGCLRVLPRSHDQQRVPHVQSGQYKGTRLSLEVAVEVDESKAVDCVLKAGEVSLHHPYAIHGSNPNRTDSSRIGFAIRFVSPEVSQSLPHHAVVLARGNDDYRHYEILGSPPADEIEQGIARQAEVARWIDSVPRSIGEQAPA